MPGKFNVGDHVTWNSETGCASFGAISSPFSMIRTIAAPQGVSSLQTFKSAFS
jgi:hypothetical protein